MGRINFARVLIGGFVAGIIINASEFVLNSMVVAEEMTAAMAAMNKPPIDPSMIVWFVLLSFGFGFILVWTYAAIRPRFGPGIGTAICAASLCWGLGYLFPNLFFIVMDLFPRNMIILTTAWGLVEVVIAGIAGAWAYTEI
jgi:hypothetical protein